MVPRRHHAIGRDEHPALRDRSLWDSRERFIGGSPPAGKVRPVIARSWERSRESGVRADGDPATRYSDFDPERRLLRLARPILDRLEDEVAETDAVVILTDAHGLVLDRRAGSPSLRRGLDRVFLAPGHLYAEDTVGTNGIGTASEDRSATWVIGSEHYAEWLRWLACAGVPIRDPITGRVEGILDLTCRLQDTNPLMLPFMREGARQIEQQLYEDASQRDRELLERFAAVARRSRRPVVAVNDQTVISNAAAARLLVPADHMLLWNHIADAVASEGGVAGRFRLSQGSLAEFRCVSFERGDLTRGAVLEIDVQEPELSPRGRRSDPPRPAPVDLPGRSLVWRQVCARASELAETSLPVLIVGEPGAGKLALARLIHERSPARADLIVADAALAGVQGGKHWLARLSKQLAGPVGTIVLRHLDTLDGSTIAALSALLAGHARVSRPRLLATLTRSPDGPTRSELPHLPHFQAIITVPPLRERLEDIVDIVPVLVRRHAGDLGPRCGAELIQALMRGDWPFNVAQLENLLLSMLTRRRVGELTVHDLPAEYQNVSWRRLSPIERAERGAILQALAHTRGNKSQAAAHLGIARATLYRKLKELGITHAGAVTPT